MDVAESTDCAVWMFWAFCTARCIPSATALAEVPSCMEADSGSCPAAAVVQGIDDVAEAAGTAAAMGCAEPEAASC